MTRAAGVSLAAWQQALIAIDRCPYVGPRPQTEVDQGMLIGRERDLGRITRSVLDRRLVVLHGYSGSGKSSLLQNGLIGELRRSGFAVFVCRKWGSLPKLRRDMPADAADDLASRYVASGIRLTHLDASAGVALPPEVAMDELADRENLGHFLDERLGGSAVLILDQFEELLRRPDRPSAERLVAWVLALVRLYEVKVVLSLRTDSLHLLDPLLRGVKPFTLDRLQLDELRSEEAIAKVIRTTHRGLGGAEHSIEDAAVEHLLGVWRQSEPPLLELQATLYALHFRARSAQGPQGTTAPTGPSHEAEQRPISPQDVQDLVAVAASADLDPFSFGLRESIRIKMAHAHSAATQIGCDGYLTTGAREIARRVAPLLSSAGHKVPVDQGTLTRRALARELATLSEGLVNERAPDPTAERSTVVAAAVDDACSETLGCGDVLVPCWRQDLTADRGARSDVTAGPMMGASASETLREEVRRVAFAIEWLKATEIVRQDPDGTLSLIHDGAGSALIAWATAEVDCPAFALRQLTGSRGEHFVWRNDVIGRHDGDAGYDVIANVSWRDCRITTRFRRVVFVNCDFSGSRFESCTFEGVTFVNCLLDDANFQHCSFLGGAETVTVHRERLEGAAAARLAPSFVVDANDGDVADHCAYLSPSAGSCTQFFSDTAGVPARPGPPPQDHAGETIGRFGWDADGETDLVSWEPGQQPVAIRPVDGGLAMFGGRLCFLTLYRCVALNHGSITFRHVSGDGLDIVEHDSGTISIQDCAIRGLSMSRDDASEPWLRRSRDSHDVRLLVDNSIVANLYFGDGLQGSSSIVGSVVVMLINANDPSPGSFSVALYDCRYQFLVNAEEPRASTEDSSMPQAGGRYFERVEGSDSRYRLCDRKAFAADMEAMDYRFRPEVWEARQRKQRPRRSSRTTSSEAT